MFSLEKPSFTTVSVRVNSFEKSLVEKTPSDGLSGKSDEDKLGIKYSSLDNLIRNGEKKQDYERIMHLNKISAHKRIVVAKYENNLPNTLK